MAVSATASAIISWLEYKTIFGADDSEQDKYQTLINQASAIMEGFCQRALKARDFTDQLLDGNGRDVVVYPQHPLQSVTSLNVDANRVFGLDTLLPSTEFFIENASGLVFLKSGKFPTGKKMVKTTFRAGYETTDQEYQVLQSACLELVKWMMSRYSGFIGKRSETNADGMNTSFEIEIPLNVQRMLARFVEISL